MTQQVLVTGATGNVGTILVPSLAATAEVSVRALVHDPDKAAPLVDAGAEISVGAFDDADSLRAAMSGVDTFVLIAPPNPDCVSQNAAIIEAAKQSGVRKIVRISAIRAAEDGRTENTRLHGQCDRLVQGSGLAYVILRPNYYMQNIFLSLDTINADSVFYAGMGDGRFAMIDVRDVAECAVIAATSGEFDNKILELSGPASISFTDVAGILSDVTGRPINYVAISPDDVKASMLQFGLDEWMAELLREYSVAYGDGWGDLVTDNVAKLTGHTARSFSAFANEVLAPALI